MAAKKGAPAQKMEGGTLDPSKAEGDKPATTADRMEALEKAVHGLQVKHGLQDKRLDALETVNETRLRSYGLID